MKKLVVLLIFVAAIGVFVAIRCDDFDETEAAEIVKLNKSDIALYSEFHEALLEDFDRIQKVMEKVHGSVLIGGNAECANCYVRMGTNSYYLAKVDATKYYGFIDELERRNIYDDDIRLNSAGVVVFTLKDMTNQHWDDYNDTYTHELIFGTRNMRPGEIEGKYVSSPKKIHTQFAVSDNITYVYYTTITGW